MMGIFGNSSPFDQDVEKATSENNGSEDWALILEICDRASGGGAGAARDCLRAVTRRLAHHDPHVQLQAATLLDACVANCGRAFLLEVASREFLQELRRLLARAQPPVARRLRALLRKWAENEFKGDAQLDLVPSLYHKLRAEGHEFEAAAAAAAAPPPAAAAAAAAAAQREQDELARAIALSLREAGAGGGGGALYPRVEEAAPPAPPAPPAPAPPAPPRKVRALYDFEAAEDNELTFLAGEIVTVTDASDPNWWKGSNERGEGLFPANFVTPDLAPPKSESRGGGKSVQFSEPSGAAAAGAAATAGGAAAAGEEESDSGSEGSGIEEAALDAALAALHASSPEAGAAEAEAAEAALRRREARALRQAGAVDEALQRADRRHARLTQLSAELVDALNLYHHLMRDPLKPQPLAPPAAHAALPLPPHLQPLQYYAPPPHPAHPAHPAHAAHAAHPAHAAHMLPPSTQPPPPRC